MDFKIAIERDEDGWYIVTVPALPGCISQGKTEEEAKKNIAEAIELHLNHPEVACRTSAFPYAAHGTYD